MKENCSPGKTPERNIPLPVIIGLALPVVISVYFYITYAQSAWFWQDDFGFIAHYANSVHLNQLFDFNNFGRFVSRNAYWHWGLKYFSYNAQYFYVFNFFIILATSFLLYKIFSEKYGRFEGFVASLFYFVLPATLTNYAWLSSSQHMIGHFFVILFVYLFVKNDSVLDRPAKALRVALLALVLMLGFASNIFMSMVLSLPIWMMLTDKYHRRSKTNYIVLSVGLILFALFFYKLSGNQSGAYSTSYTLATLVTNLEFYFKSKVFAVLWLAAVAFGAVYALLKKKYFLSWLFLASVVFFIPFAFFEHQRYIQYGALTYLFFLLAVWSLLIESVDIQWPGFVKYAGLALVLIVFTESLEPPIRYYSENPRGAAQKQQIDFLRLYDARHPDVENYCFQSDSKVENITGVKEWDIPAEWWFVGFGSAFSLFVNHEKKYELVQNAAQCDVVFVFKGARMEMLDQH